MKRYSTILIILVVIVSCRSNHDETNRHNESIPIIPILSSECVSNQNNIVFDRKIMVNDNTLGYARIRNNSNYFHPGHDDNLIGNVPCGTIMNAHLPEAFREIVDGMVQSTRNPYYIIQLKDSTGNNCIGYIAGHVVSEIKD